MVPAAVAAPETFEQAKIELRSHVYADRNQSAEGTLYCGCHWDWVGRSGGRINFSSCGIRVRAQEHRAARIEWEHIVPAAVMGKQRQCWQEGGRANCVATDPVFRVMEADMHNLAPSAGELNADRSNFRFGVLPSVPYRHGACDFKVDFRAATVEPRNEVKGRIARVYFYVHDRYDLRMSESQQRLFMAWDRQFPVSAWEIERDRRIAARMGHYNPFVIGERTWSLGHRNSADGIYTPVRLQQGACKLFCVTAHPTTGDRPSGHRIQ
jgi:deoxyribonuclease-1